MLGLHKRRYGKKLGPVGSFIFGSIFILIGVGITYFKGWPNYQSAKESLNWPQVTGTILSSRVTQRQSKDQTLYSADIRYSYVVKGIELQSSQIYVGSEGVAFSHSRGAYQYTQKYPLGRFVTVYYSPKDRTNAILEPGVKITHYSYLGFGAAFGLIGFFLFLSSLFKFLLLTAMGGVALGYFFKGRKRRPYHSSPAQARSGRRSVSSYAQTSSHNQTMDIDLDSEMVQLNKVSSSSLQMYDEPWNYNWIVEISKKKYGPYSFDKLVSYFKRGKIEGNYGCYPSTGGRAVKIEDIVHRRAG